jgi:hypothetical protein
MNTVKTRVEQVRKQLSLSYQDLYGIVKPKIKYDSFRKQIHGNRIPEEIIKKISYTFDVPEEWLLYNQGDFDPSKLTMESVKENLSAQNGQMRLDRYNFYADEGGENLENLAKYVIKYERQFRTQVPAFKYWMENKELEAKISALRENTGLTD